MHHGVEMRQANIPLVPCLVLFLLSRQRLLLHASSALQDPPSTLLKLHSFPFLKLLCSVMACNPFIPSLTSQLGTATVALRVEPLTLDVDIIVCRFYMLCRYYILSLKYVM
uniref:Uncharacterized protein n=1 Tax=Grammatophora oceanica TaxID=210454 RepID=A0A7S1UUZ6_9STRA